MSYLGNISTDDKDRLLEVIQRSQSISRHVDFYMWLQDIRYFLHHDVLVATWGDFSSGSITYDVTSSIPGIHTRKVMGGGDIEPLISTLYYRWLTNGQQWYGLDHLDLLAADSKQNIMASCLGQFTQMKSVIVHGIHDKRSQDDCLYVFFAQEPSFRINQMVLHLLLPHIDAALRRIESLPRADAAARELPSGVSAREDEILSWVCLGKTNEEIGSILAISPNTVKNHLKKIFQKLSVSSRAQAVAKYRQAINPNFPGRKLDA